MNDVGVRFKIIGVLIDCGMTSPSDVRKEKSKKCRGVTLDFWYEWKERFLTGWSRTRMTRHFKLNLVGGGVLKMGGRLKDSNLFRQPGSSQMIQDWLAMARFPHERFSHETERSALGREEKLKRDRESIKNKLQTLLFLVDSHPSCCEERREATTTTPTTTVIVATIIILLKS